MITSFLASQHAFCFQQILAEKESTTTNSVVGGGNLKNNILGGNLKNNNNSLHRHHQGPLGNIVHHNFDHGEHDDNDLMPKVRILFIHIKGHLISKGQFGVFKSTKKSTKFCKDFCPKL